tara:strand:- start:198 stop:1073 length:876 start_codon:yes stop_codon:yes gene_type:complete
MRLYLRYIVFLLFFTFQGEAKRLHDYERQDTSEGLTYSEKKTVQSTVTTISWLIIIGFFINLIPFLQWIKKQKPTSEFMMYQVRGKFTYFSVLAWVDAIENGLGRQLKKKRILLANWQVVASRKKRPYAVFKPHVEKLLYLASFGNSPRLTAFSRMRLYPRIVYIWSLVILFVPVNYGVSYFTIETSNYFSGMMLGLMAGAIPSLLLFKVVKWVFNFTLEVVGISWIDSKGDAGYLHELMHQFSGIYNGHWDSIEWDDSMKASISGLDTSEETIEYIKTNLFSGKGSNGSW